MTEAHRDTRPQPDRDPLPPPFGSTQLERRSDGLVCLSGCARDGALAGFAWAASAPARAGDRALGRRLAGRLRARALPGGAAAAAVATRPGPQPLALRARRAAGRRLRRHRQRPHARPLAGERSRTRWWRCACAARWRRPSRGGGATAPPHLAPAAEMAARFRDHPEAVAETCGWPSACASTSPATSATATPARRTRRRPGAGRDLPGAARAPLRRHGRASPRRGRRLEDELALIRQAAASRASSSSTTTSSSWRARWRSRSAAATRRGCCCRPAAGGARA